MVPRRHNTRPLRIAPGRCRYKTLPAHPLSPHIRYKTLPAHPKWPNLACFARAWRTFYRFRQEEATQGELYTEYKSEKGLAITAHRAPRAWRAPEGPEGQAAVPAGGGGAWPGFEPTRITLGTPGPTGMEGAGGARAPGCGARERRRGAAIAHQLAQELRQSTTLFAQQESRRAAAGTKLSPQPPSHRMRGTKFALLARNGPIWHVLPAQGEFCTALVSKTPSRENFVPVSPPRIHAGRTLYRTQGTNRANHNSTPRTTGVERTSGTTGPRRDIRGRRRHHRQANFACNSPTAQTNAS